MANILELNSKGLYQSSGKEKKSCLVFRSLTKREIRHLHVVVVERRLTNVQKSVMYVQSCCFANKSYRLFAVLVAVAVAPGEKNVTGACPKDKLEFKFFLNTALTPLCCKRHFDLLD